MTQSNAKPLVAILMGSQSDWEIVKNAPETLKKFDVPCVSRVLSAHRTPDATAEFVKQSEKDGVEVFIAAAGAAAHLAGVVASFTIRPVLAIPIESPSLKGLDSLLSMVQMPGGIPVGTLAIGKAGAVNAGLLAVQILATSRPELAAKLRKHRQDAADAILKTVLPPV